MNLKPIWMAVIKQIEEVIFCRACHSEYQAQKAVVSYLCQHKNFGGRNFDEACFWIGEKALGLDVMVFCMQPDDFRDVWGQLALFRSDLPLREKGLYRVIYEIDVGASSAMETAGMVHQIMSDSDSLPPVLDVIDCKGNTIRIDLSQQERGRLCSMKSVKSLKRS